jgi:hypothetical protein
MGKMHLRYFIPTFFAPSHASERYQKPPRTRLEAHPQMPSLTIGCFEMHFENSMTLVSLFNLQFCLLLVFFPHTWICCLLTTFGNCFSDVDL